MSQVVLERVSKRFGARAVVDDVSLTIERGEIVALLGPSGSGKTTLLRLIAGLEAPDGGRVVLDGETVSGGGAFVPPERRRVGFVFQSFALFPHLSVEQNVGFGARDPARVPRLLEHVRLTARRTAAVDTLSGGEQQRVALARALAREPRVVLLDEPFANLDAALRRGVQGELTLALRGAGATAVLVTHDAAEAFAMADRIAVVADGRLLQVGEPAAVYAAPVSLEVAERTGEVVHLPGRSLGGGRIACALGELAAIDGGLPAGRDVAIALRPEQLRLVAGDAARVTGRVFEGATSCVRLALGDLALTARQVGGSRPAVGERFAVAVDGAVAAFLP